MVRPSYPSLIITRHLFDWEKTGHMTCFFQTKADRVSDRIRKVLIPREIEDDPEMRRRMARDVFALGVVIRGTGKIIYKREERIFPLAPGTVFQHNGHKNTEVILSVSDDFEEASLLVDGDTGRHLLAVRGWNPSFLCCPMAPDDHLIELYRSMIGYMEDSRNNSRFLIIRFLDLVEYVQGRAEPVLGSDPFIIQACHSLDEFCRPSDKIGEIAAAMGMKYEAFRQRFLRRMEISPREYQLKCRMEKACHLLLKLTVGETAERLGYSDPFTFSRQFKQHSGLSPRDYRILFSKK